MNMAKTLKEFSSDQVVVRGGQVEKVEHWCCWNGEPHPVISIKRLGEKSFSCYCGDPEHGGGTAFAPTIEEAIEGLHPDVQRPLLEAFNAESITEERLKQLFPKYKIVSA